jgi:hypothetical protein
VPAGKNGKSLICPGTFIQVNAGDQAGEATGQEYDRLVRRILIYDIPLRKVMSI